MAILIDTNVLLRAAQPDHPHHSTAFGALERCRASGQRLVLVPQNIYEFWVVLTRPTDQNGFGLSAEQAWQKTEELLGLFDLLRDERMIFDHWQTLVRTYAVIGKGAHDARLTAAMKRHSIPQILSFNARDFARYDVEALQPEDVVAGRITL